MEPHDSAPTPGANPRALSLRPDDVAQLATQLKGDADDLSRRIGEARISLFGQLGASTAPTLGVDRRSPFALVMAVHNAAFERVVRMADGDAAFSQAVGAASGLASRAFAAVDGLNAGGLAEAADDWLTGKED